MKQLSLEGLYCIFKEIAQNLDISFILNPYGIFRAKSLDGCRMSEDILKYLWTLDISLKYLDKYFIKSRFRYCNKSI